MTTREDAETIQLLTRTLVMTTWFLAQNVKNNMKHHGWSKDDLEREVRNSPIVAQACDVLKRVLDKDFDPLAKMEDWT